MYFLILSHHIIYENVMCANFCVGWRMASSGTLRRVALVRTTRSNIPEDAILHLHTFLLFLQWDEESVRKASVFSQVLRKRMSLMWAWHHGIPAGHVRRQMSIHSCMLFSFVCVLSIFDLFTCLFAYILYSEGGLSNRQHGWRKYE
jgi:hypothetical protein